MEQYIRPILIFFDRDANRSSQRRAGCQEMNAVKLSFTLLVKSRPIRNYYATCRLSSFSVLHHHEHVQSKDSSLSVCLSIYQQHFAWLGRPSWIFKKFFFIFYEVCQNPFWDCLIHKWYINYFPRIWTSYIISQNTLCSLPFGKALMWKCCLGRQLSRFWNRTSFYVCVYVFPIQYKPCSSLQTG